MKAAIYNEFEDNYAKDVANLMQDQELIYPEESDHMIDFIRGLK